MTPWRCGIQTADGGHDRHGHRRRRRRGQRLRQGRARDLVEHRHDAGRLRQAGRDGPGRPHHLGARAGQRVRRPVPELRVAKWTRSSWSTTTGTLAAGWARSSWSGTDCDSWGAMIDPTGSSWSRSWGRKQRPSDTALTRGGWRKPLGPSAIFAPSWPTRGRDRAPEPEQGVVAARPPGGDRAAARLRGGRRDRHRSAVGTPSRAPSRSRHRVHRDLPGVRAFRRALEPRRAADDRRRSRSSSGIFVRRRRARPGSTATRTASPTRRSAPTCSGCFAPCSCRCRSHLILAAMIGVPPGAGTWRRSGPAREAAAGTRLTCPALPGWRNGRLGALKKLCPYGRAGSNPAPGTP